MDRVGSTLDAVTEDRRSDYLFHTPTAADAVGCCPNKFGDWWYRTRRKLRELAIRQPGELAAEMAALFAHAEAERQRRASSPRRIP